MYLYVCPEESVNEFYLNHGSYHEGDAGLDLLCPEEIIVHPYTQGITIDFKIRCEAWKYNRNDITKSSCIHKKNRMVSYQLVPRSSISKTPLRMSNSIGIIDAGYRGNIMAKVDNISNTTFTIEKGTRLFQIIGPKLEPIVYNITSELNDSTRSTGGFGSTGST